MSWAAVALATACSALVDTSGLSGNQELPVQPGGAPDSGADSGVCAACTDGGRCIGSVCMRTDGLVAWWSFEGAPERFVEERGGGHEGAKWGDVRRVEGKVGPGIELGPGACILVPESPALRMENGTAVTMMAWIRPAACEQGSGGHRMVLNKEDTYELAVKCPESVLQEAIQAGEWRWHGRGELRGGTWQHVAVTWDGQTVRHYVDGELRDLRPQTGRISARDTGLGIGCRDVGRDGRPVDLREWFEGAIDEVAVYARALDRDEISAYVQATR